MSNPNKCFEPKQLPGVSKRQVNNQLLNQEPRSFKDAPLTLSWGFQIIDTDPSCRWSFCQDNLDPTFWADVAHKMGNFETMTPAAIFVNAKKSNHSIRVNDLEKDAKDRLHELGLHLERIFSIRIEGKGRLYGYMNGTVFLLIWYDKDHGNNNRCVCRSYLKHT